MKNSRLFFYAAVHSLGVLIYISLVASVMNNGERIFGDIDNNFLGPVLFLLLFVFSALVTSVLVLGRPILFWLEGLKKEAIRLLLYTIGSLFAVLMIVFLAVFLMKN